MITFNIRMALADDGANSWQYRKNFVYEYLLDSKADIICLQEVVPAVKSELTVVLAEAYDCVGEGRLAEPREYDECNLIAYKKCAFELLNKSHFWLSDTPDVAGSKYPTQLHWPRTCTHVTLRSESGVYDVFATHLDNEDAAARAKGLDLIISRAVLCDKAIVCGDFNDTPDNVSRWVNGRLVDLTRDLFGTYTEYGKTASKIDYIFVNGGIRQLSESVCDRQIRNGLYISDHFPVFTNLI